MTEIASPTTNTLKPIVAVINEPIKTANTNIPLKCNWNKISKI